MEILSIRFIDFGLQNDYDQSFGDYGTQFGKLIVAYKNCGNRQEVEEDPIPTSIEIICEISRRSGEKSTQLEEEAREWLKKLEEGNQEAKGIRWQWFREVSLRIWTGVISTYKYFI